MTLTDRQRVEIALAPRMLFNAVAVAGENSDDTRYKSVRNKLTEASLSVLLDLPRSEQPKVARRVERAAKEALAEYVGKTSCAKLAMVVYYFVESLSEKGILHMVDGSPFAEGFTELLPLLDDHFAIPEMDASAKRQAMRLLTRCQSMGYFRN